MSSELSVNAQSVNAQVESAEPQVEAQESNRPVLDIGSQAERDHNKGYRNKPFYDVCIASVRQFDNSDKKRFGFAAPVMWPDELPTEFEYATDLPDLKFSNLDGDCFFHLDRGGYVLPSDGKMPQVLRPNENNAEEYKHPIASPSPREYIVVARTVNERGNFAIWWCYLEDYLNVYRQMCSRPIFRLQEQSSTINVKNPDGSISKPSETKFRTVWMGVNIEDLVKVWPAKQFPIADRPGFKRFFSVQDANDHTMFYEIDFDPRTMTQEQLDAKLQELYSQGQDAEQQITSHGEQEIPLANETNQAEQAEATDFAEEVIRGVNEELNNELANSQ